MNLYRRYTATFIGLFFTLGGLLLYYTFILPIFIVFPLPFILEVIFQNIDQNQAYFQIGYKVIFSLIVFFFLTTFIFFYQFNKQIRNHKNYFNSYVVLYMLLLLFIIHPLVFYIHLSSKWESAGDGQFFLTIGETFQLSSYPFLMIGLAVDIFKYIQLKRSA